MPKQIEDGEYLIGQPLTAITANLFSYGGSNNLNQLKTLQKDSRQQMIYQNNHRKIMSHSDNLMQKLIDSSISPKTQALNQFTDSNGLKSRNNITSGRQYKNQTQQSSKFKSAVTNKDNLPTQIATDVKNTLDTVLKKNSARSGPHKKFPGQYYQKSQSFVTTMPRKKSPIGASNQRQPIKQPTL